MGPGSEMICRALVSPRQGPNAGKSNQGRKVSAVLMDMWNCNMGVPNKGHNNNPSSDSHVARGSDSSPCGADLPNTAPGHSVSSALPRGWRTLEKGHPGVSTANRGKPDVPKPLTDPKHTAIAP